MYSLLVLIAVQFLFHTADTTATVSLQLVRFSIPGSKTQDKKCCDGQGFYCRDKCDPYFKICINDNLSSKGDFNDCSLAEYETGILMDTSEGLLNDTIGHTASSNPASFKLSSWPGAILVKIELRDDDSPDGYEVIDRFVIEVNKAADVSEVKKQDTPVILMSSAMLEARISVYCDPNYYGPGCDALCDPSGGNYECSEDGSKQCPLGVDCELRIRKSNPCKAGDTCHETGTGYSCECPKEITGKTEVNPRESNLCTCNNGSGARMGHHSYACIMVVILASHVLKILMNAPAATPA